MLIVGIRANGEWKNGNDKQQPMPDELVEADERHVEEVHVLFFPMLY